MPFALAFALAAVPPPPIVVTGRALPALQRPAPGATLLAAELALPGRRLEEGLAQAPGVQLFRRASAETASPTAQGVSWRGLGGNASSRAGVLLDGVPQADPFAGWVAWPALSMLALEAATVDRTPGARWGGSAALAGTVRLASAPPGARALAEAGGRGRAGAEAALAAPLGRAALALEGGVRRADGALLVPPALAGPVDRRAGFAQRVGRARLIVPLDGSTELQAAALAFDDRRRRGLAGARSEIDGHDLSLRLVHGGPWPVEAIVWRQERDFRQTSVATSADRRTTNITADQFTTPAAGWGARAEVRPVGSDTRRLALSADGEASEGRSLEAYGFVAGVPGGRREAGGTSHRLGLMAEGGATLAAGLEAGATLRLDHWRLGAGRRTAEEGGRPVLAAASAPRDGWRVGGHAGLAWTPPRLEAWTLSAAAGRALRLPTLNELHRPFRVGADVTLANPALRPEVLTSAEAGVAWQPLAALRLALGLFEARLDGPIANVAVGTGPAALPGLGFVPAGGQIRQRANLDRLSSRGLEAEASATWGPWSAGGAGALVRARFADAWPQGGRPPAQVPAFQASGWVARDDGATDLRLQLRHTGPRAEDDQGLRRLAAATTLDLAAGLRVGGGVRLFAEVENLVDETVEVGFLGPLPERAHPRGWRLGAAWRPGGR